MVAACLHERTLPLKRSLRTAHGTITQRRVLVLVLMDDAGHAGYGEAAPLPAFGGEDPVACREALDGLLPKLADFARDWLHKDRPDASLGSLERRLARTPCARACVEGALLDLLAQRRGVPLARLLAGEEATPPEALPVNVLLNGSDAEELAEAASSLVAEGWRTMKLKVSGDPASEAQKVRVLRDWVGKQVRIRIDAGGAWDIAGARAFLEACRDCDLEYIEQPLPPGELDGLAALRREFRTMIAVDEGVLSAGEVGRIASRQAADIVVLKPMVLGGWRPTRQAAELARSVGLEVVVTTTLDGSVGRALATHVACALGCDGRAQGLATGALFMHDLTDRAIPARGGRVALPQEAGLGIGTLLPEVVAGASDPARQG